MNRNTLLVVAVLAALGAGTAMAAPQADDAPRPATRINPDKNNDGVIDRAEAAAFPRLAEKFDALDKNKDGKLSADERPQRRGMHGGRRGGKGDARAAFAKLDTNQDGKLSRAEAAADPKFAERFDKMDLNKDGFIDRTDRELAAKNREERFAAADTNKDGKLSRDEAKVNSRMAENFDRLDVNKDGFLSKDELPSRKGAMRLGSF